MTMPGEAADDPSIVWRLLRAGMDCARVNCAHDGPDEWRRMVSNVRTAAQGLGRTCQVLMDLPGPKLRTGPVAEGPKVVRLRPGRDARGVPVAPAEAVLVPIGLGSTADADVTVVPVPLGWVRGFAPGDPCGMPATTPESWRSARPVIGAHGSSPRTRRTWSRGPSSRTPHGRAGVGRLPAVERYLCVQPGDVVILTPDRAAVPSPPRPANATAAYFRMGCSLPEALGAARPASPAGPSSAEGVASTSPTAISNWPPWARTTPPGLCRRPCGHGRPLVRAASRGRRRTAAPPRPPRPAGHRVGAQDQTASGFERLPELVLAGMASEPIGVMAARGDLAVECGFERLAEVQEEILWLCDAAHVPVIWATQILDQMARTGRPSRAEVSDAEGAAPAPLRSGSPELRPHRRRVAEPTDRP